MENSDSTTTSRLKQEPGACGHKWCKGRRECKNVGNHRRYLERRKQGLPWWKANCYTPSSYLRVILNDRVRYATPEGRHNSRVKGARKRKKDNELYGGQPSANVLARGRWILAREQNISTLYD